MWRQAKTAHCTFGVQQPPCSIANFACICCIFCFFFVCNWHWWMPALLHEFSRCNYPLQLCYISTHFVFGGGARRVEAPALSGGPSNIFLEVVCANCCRSLPQTHGIWVNELRFVDYMQAAARTCRHVASCMSLRLSAALLTIAYVCLCFFLLAVYGC